MSSEYLTEEYAVDIWHKVKGRMELDGSVLEPLDEAEVVRAIEEMRDNVDAVVVSGYACIRNPSHEESIRKLVHDRLDVPVICAHDLSMALGFGERTLTAVMNAHPCQGAARAGGHHFH